MGVGGAVVAAQATMAAASAYNQHKAAGAQAETSRAEATITHAQQEHELARTAAAQSEEFRRGLASTLASASARGGAGMARQFGGQAIASYSEDMEAIKRAYTINDIQKQNKLAQAAALKSSTSIGALVGLGKDVIGAGTSVYNQKKLEDLLGKTAKGGLPTPKNAVAPVSSVADIAKFKPNTPYAPTSNYAGTQSGKWNPLG